MKEQELQEAAGLIKEYRELKENEATEALKELIAKWEKDYNATFSITQPQVVITLK